MNNVYIEKNRAEKKQPPEVFYKKCALKNFAKFTGKYLCWSLFFTEQLWTTVPGRTVLKKYLEGWVERRSWQKEEPIKIAETARSGKKNKYISCPHFYQIIEFILIRRSEVELEVEQKKWNQEEFDIEFQLNLEGRVLNQYGRISIWRTVGTKNYKKD